MTEIVLNSTPQQERIKEITKALGVKRLADALGKTPSAVYRCHQDGVFPSSWREVVLAECRATESVSISIDESFSLFGVIRPKSESTNKDTRRLAPAENAA